jgi:hypothetical protein
MEPQQLNELSDAELPKIIRDIKAREIINEFDESWENWPKKDK